MKTLLLFLVSFPLLSSAASNISSKQYYYGNFASSETRQIKQQLFVILSQYHIPQDHGPDLIEASCKSSNCYRHTDMSYTGARQYLFGWLHLSGMNPKNYSLTTYYCQKNLTNVDLSSKDPLAPNNIPDYKVINTEHSWPQSKFSKKFSANMQKTDIHILFPVLSNVNSIRSNKPFGEVTEPKVEVCDQALSGLSKENKNVFEPSDAVKGDIARALFYFSVRYQMPIDQVQEAYLRKWHHLDPVDEKEDLRNEQIYSLQYDRNPFIDMPYLIDEIEDF